MMTESNEEVDFDGETVLIPGIMEHIERAGVHSGDSMAVSCWKGPLTYGITIA